VTDADPDLLLRDPATGEPLPPRAQPGYYPGYSTLAQRRAWEPATRELVLDRVENVPPIRFFSADEIALLSAICDRILPQDDRDAGHRIPIVPQIDKRLYEGSSDGYRYDDMPPDPQAYRRALAAIDGTARRRFARGFLELAVYEREALLAALHDADLAGADDLWHGLPVHRFWMLLVQDCVEAYYAHPYAWDEIGFGGPAYPRAYMRLERGDPEPWEVRERRYAWRAPDGSRSDAPGPVAGTTEHYGAAGAGGTH